MKQTWKSLLVAGALTCTLTGSAFAATPATLTDISNSYAKDQITQLYNSGIVTGDEDHNFNPTGNMTRSQLAVMLTKALNLTPDSAASTQFQDVATWAKPYVGALVKAGIASGYDAKTYGGNDPVTREQLAIFFVRAFDATDLSTQLNLSGTTFIDDGNIDSYAKPSVALMQKLGFLNGYSTANGMEFNPIGHADRQAVAHLVSEFFFNKDTYTKKMTDIKTVDQILTQTVDAMKSVKSLSVSVQDTMNLQDPTDASQNMNMTEAATLDLTLAPLSSHGTVTANGTVSGQAQSVNSEFYLANDMLYYQDQTTGKWMKMASPVSAQDLTDTFGSDPNGYHEMAADLKVTAETADTYTLTASQNESDLGAMSPNLPFGDASITLVIDKNTHLINSISMNAMKQNVPVSSQTFTFTNYNNVQPVTVPQTVLDTATPVQDPTQAAPAAAELSHVSKLLSR